MTSRTRLLTPVSRPTHRPVAERAGTRSDGGPGLVASRTPRPLLPIFEPDGRTGGNDRISRRDQIDGPHQIDRGAPLIPVVRASSPIYGLDIETDTTVDGLDPSVSRIVAVAVAGPDGVRVFDDRHEALLLDRLDWHLASADPGVIATWNGAAFDLPFLADRAAAFGVSLGLRLTADPRIPSRDPLPGHRGAYRGSWHGHAHLDAYQLFRADVVPALGVSGGLKNIARLCGLDPIELPAATLHTQPRDQVRAYVSSDAWCTRALVQRRWPSARGAVDRHPPLDPEDRCASASTSTGTVVDARG